MVENSKKELKFQKFEGRTFGMDSKLERLIGGIIKTNRAALETGIRSNDLSRLMGGWELPNLDKVRRLAEWSGEDRPTVFARLRLQVEARASELEKQVTTTERSEA